MNKKLFCICCMSAQMLFAGIAISGSAYQESSSGETAGRSRADDIMNKQIPRFAQVDVNLYRGGQPSREGLRALKEKGIKKIINFRAEKKLGEKERTFVESLGMEYVSLPWTIYTPYRQDIFDAFFDAIKDKDEKPVFFHCKRGSERTGVIAAAYLIQEKDITLDEAYAYADDYDILFMWFFPTHNKIATFYRNNTNK